MAEENKNEETEEVTDAAPAAEETPTETPAPEVAAEEAAPEASDEAAPAAEGEDAPVEGEAAEGEDAPAKKEEKRDIFAELLGEELAPQGFGSGDLLEGLARAGRARDVAAPSGTIFMRLASSRAVCRALS